jgi:energy-coupling factor transport system permease protein
MPHAPASRGGPHLSPLGQLGRYVPRSSPVHRLDARVKLVSAFLLALAAALGGRWEAQALLLAWLLAVFGLARLPLRLLGRGLRSALWLLGFIAAANLGWAWIVRRAAWAGGEASVQDPAALGLLVLRLFDLLVVAAIFTATTVPVDAAEGLERLARPLARLRVPVHEIGFLLVLSLSFVPIFRREAQRLADAHRLKMGDRRWGTRARLRAAAPLLVPLFLAVLRRADELAVALDARGFEPGARRTSLVPGRLGSAEVAALVACSAAIAVCVTI